MNEADTRANLIDPALKSAGWGETANSQVRREVITPGRLQGGGGKRAKGDIADYVLIHRGQKLAVIEAKRRDLPDTEGTAQAKRYAERLQTPFAYATNGRSIYQIDMQTGKESRIPAYPTPDELWKRVFPDPNPWRERFGAIPFETGGGQWELRYYQHNAINQALEAIAAGRDRILLTLATGTGKTAIAFQITWKLFHSRWSLNAWRNATKPERQPRILFLADRNILANQAFNSFAAFPDDALVRIAPDEIRKKGRVPKNGSVFFTIFQTFMSGSDAAGRPQPSFGEYPPDFFDLVIIDECHRGGANDEGNWRGILDYFAPAVQIGLTATPKRTHNADTYAYFGEPVYVYSLKEGINDGYLTPFKVKQIATTLDDYLYTSDDHVIEGEVEEGKRYVEEDFNKLIQIEGREKYRLQIVLDSIHPLEKTLVFCATQNHALLARDLINQLKTVQDVNYCVRVTANDGTEGEKFLKIFQDNEKTIPAILTTSQKLSTGVDARNIRHIVLMRPINSMIEFKQIIGRGTRLFDGKDYFTVHDFVKAYEHFNDPEWDGEPLAPEPCPRCEHIPCTCEVSPPEPCKDCGHRPCICEKTTRDAVCPDCGESPCVCQRPRMLKIKLADGKERRIQHMSATTYWSPDGKPLSATQFVERVFGTLPELFKDEDELRRLWGNPTTRHALLEGLAERGFGTEELRTIATMVEAEQSDLYDVLGYIAFAHPPQSRAERVAKRRARIVDGYDYKQQEFLSFVLDHYVAEGVEELALERLPRLIDLKYHSIGDAIAELGEVASIREVFVGFQQRLY